MNTIKTGVTSGLFSFLFFSFLFFLFFMFPAAGRSVSLSTDRLWSVIWGSDTKLTSSYMKAKYTGTHSEITLTCISNYSPHLPIIRIIFSPVRVSFPSADFRSNFQQQQNNKYEEKLNFCFRFLWNLPRTTCSEPFRFIAKSSTCSIFINVSISYFITHFPLCTPSTLHCVLDYIKIKLYKYTKREFNYLHIDRLYFLERRITCRSNTLISPCSKLLCIFSF